MKKTRLAIWILGLFWCPAVFLLTGCEKKDINPFDQHEEKWKYFGKLYLFEYDTNGTRLKIFQVQGDGAVPVTDQKLIDDLEAAAARTIYARNDAAASSKQSAQGRAAAAPVASNVFVLDLSDQFEKFDPVTKRIVSTLDLFGSGLPGQPVGMDVTADGKVAVVTKFAAPPDVPYALVIDLATFKIAAKINLPAGTAPGDVAITPDGLFAYIATTPYLDGNDSTVYVIDIAARTIATSIVIPGNATLDRIVMTPDGVSAYLSSDFSRNSFINVIDVATNTLALSASTQGSIAPLQMAMHPDGTRLYLVPTDGSTIKILSTATHTISGTIAGAGQGGLLPVGKVSVGSTPPVFTLEGRFLFVLGTPESVSMIDTSTDTQVATLSLPPIPPNPGRPRFTYFVVPDQ